MDGFGRTAQTQTSVNGAGTVSAVNTEYAPCGCSPLGKMSKQSQPYAYPPGATGSAWTVYSYEASGRTISVAQQDMYIGLRTWCPGAPKTVSVVAAVNPSNGHVTDPKTHKSLDSPESEKIARQIVQRRREQLDGDEAAVAAACKP